MSSGQFDDGTGTWSYTASPGITVTWTPASSDSTDPTISIVVDLNQNYLAAGGGNITFNAPFPPSGTYVAGDFYTGLIANLQVTIENDTGYTMTGFDLNLLNSSSTYPLDVGDVHPDNYAHIHGVEPTTFGTGETLSLYTPSGAAAAFGGEGAEPVPSQIDAVGTVASGSSVSGSGMILHEEEDPGRINSFNMNIDALFRPSIEIQNRIVESNASIQASSLFSSVTDPYGYPIISYGFYDEGLDGGYFTLNGVALNNQQWNYVPSSELSSLKYVAGTTSGIDDVDVEVWDGQNLSYYSQATVTTAASLPPPSDFNGDGRSDILWRNTDGDTVVWNSNGSGGSTGQDLGVVGTDWQIAGTGDFNGDGQSDILWRNTNGDTVLWNSNGSGSFIGEDLGIVSSAWQIAGTGDFNGDGQADILWRNTNGDTVIWNSNGSGGLTGADLGVVPNAWQIAGTGDFNGDGEADILWRNTNGDTVIWDSNGSGAFTSTDLGVVSSAWQIAGTGDFNGDGKADILWRNTNGDTVIWNSNSSGNFTGQDLGVVGAEWQVAGTGDYNGDGKADILWRNSNGDTFLWNSNSSGNFARQDLGVVTTDWTIQPT